MRENTDIALLLMSMNEYELTDTEKDRMRRVVANNAMEFLAVRDGLIGAGHRHLAADMTAMIAEYTPPPLSKALPNKTYTGEIVSIENADHIVQNIGMNILIAHAPESLDRIPGRYEKVIIKYDEKGMGTVIPREKSQSISLEH